MKITHDDMLESLYDNDAETLDRQLHDGGNPNSKDAQGMTLLMMSCRDQTGNTTRLLLERGADLEASDWQGMTAGHFAAYTNNTEAITALKEAGADLNAQDARGYTPFLYACDCNNRAAAISLIENGADITIPNNMNETARDNVFWHDHGQAMEDALRDRAARVQQGTLTEGLQDIIEKKAQQEEEGQVQTKGRLM